MTESRTEPSSTDSSSTTNSLHSEDGPHSINAGRAGTPEAEVIAALAAADHASKRPRWPLLLVGALIGGAGTYGVITYLANADDTATAERETVPLATAPVGQQDLLEEIEWAGTLGYGEAVAVAGSGGTITTAATVGATIERGDVVATVDGAPVAVFFGDTPLWRHLSEGVEGHDVFELETNLVALGYDPDLTVDIDETFTANTELMVERWQEDLGFEVTGTVAFGNVVVVEGPSTLVSIGAIGAAANGELASLAPRRSVLDIVSAVDGVVSDMRPIGAPLLHGSALFSIDDVPVVALIELDEVSAELTSDTATNLELEEVLATEGYDSEGEMTVDGIVTNATRNAIERWQTATELPLTGETDPGYYRLVPEGRVVDAVLVEEGATIVTGGPILTASTSRLSVEVVVDVSDADEFEVGQTVTIELADETTTDGVVAAISEVIRGATPQDSPTVAISIDVVANTDQNLIEGPVTVLSIGEAIDGATVVPTRALVSLAEGGFAVEKVNADGSRSLIGVELGAFDDGVVEVVDGDLAPGDEVVVPQ